MKEIKKVDIESSKKYKKEKEMWQFQIFLKDEFDHMGINQERVSNLRQKDEHWYDTHQLTTAETEAKESP